MSHEFHLVTYQMSRYVGALCLGYNVMNPTDSTLLPQFHSGILTGQSAVRSWSSTKEAVVTRSMTNQDMATHSPAFSHEPPCPIWLSTSLPLALAYSLNLSLYTARSIIGQHEFPEFLLQSRTATQIRLVMGRCHSP